MSRIDDLIREKCPNGVEYKNILDVISMKARVGWQALTKKEYLQTGEYYLITGTDFKENGSIGFESCVYVSKDRFDMDENIKVHANDILMTKDGTLGKVAFMKTEPPKPATLNGGVYRLTVISGEVLPRYMYHYFTSYKFKCFVDKVKTGGTIKHLTQKWFETLVVPVPPIEIQKEIIHILDKFAELEAELQAELDVRKKQYEHYRNELLAATSDVDIVALEKCADIGTGSSNTVDGIDNGKYPFYVRSQKPLTMNSFEYDEVATITAGDGVGVGKVFHFVNGKYALHQRAYRIHITDKRINPKFFHHYFVAKFPKFIFSNMYEGSVPSIRRPMLNKFEIPILSLDKQNQIVEILDKFEEYCNSDSGVLSLEINLRHKQYEYYRDKLLTFERKVV